MDRGHDDGVQPPEITPIGTELAIKWPDGREDYIPLETLRRRCPCAACQGEQDVLGQVHRAPMRPYGPDSFVLRGGDLVGGYGFQPRWADGHGTGIYSWEYLKAVAAGAAGTAGGPG